MHKKFNETVPKILAWAQQDCNIIGIIMIGSQARQFPPSDAWSDLDLLVLADDLAQLLSGISWLERFGRVVCSFEEYVPLSTYDWDWRVRRVLYDDWRDIDFSILPFHRLEQVLRVNQEILSKGYQVIHDTSGGRLEQALSALLKTVEPAAPSLSEAEVNEVISNLLFHVIWAFKKIKRNELWTAVSCINCYMKGLLLQLIEVYNSSIKPGEKAVIQYNGRFLEQRTDPDILQALSGCFTRYDAEEASETLANLVEITRALATVICERNGWALDEQLFEQVKTIYIAMKESELNEYA